MDSTTVLSSFRRNRRPNRTPRHYVCFARPKAGVEVVVVVVVAVAVAAAAAAAAAAVIVSVVDWMTFLIGRKPGLQRLS